MAGEDADEERRVALGRRVEMARRARNWSQADLGKEAKISQPVISKIETGKKLRSDADYLARIAAATGTSIEFLMGQPGAKEPKHTATDEPRAMSPPASKLPPGLHGFLERHAKRLNITRRERSYLEGDRTQTEAWVVKDDGFWERRLKFWREELKIQDKAPGIGGEEDSE